MDFSKALVAIKAGCEVRLPEWSLGVTIGASDSRRYLLVSRDIMSDDWEIAKWPKRRDGESRYRFTSRIIALKNELCGRGFFGVEKRAGRENPAAVAARLAEATVSAVDLSAALSQKDDDVHCEAPYVAKGSAVSAGEVRDEGQPVVKYGLVIEFGSAEALREAMRCQRVEFTVFGIGPPA